jgi:hypothetical protein
MGHLPNEGPTGYRVVVLTSRHQIALNTSKVRAVAG